MQSTLPITLYAIERGRAPARLPRSSRILENAYFDVLSTPVVPLRVGLRVDIHSLTPVPPSPNDYDMDDAPAYTSTPADVTGEIVGIRTVELAVTEFIVQNDNERSPLQFAYLSIKHVPGVTVHLGLWRTITRTMLLPLLPHTRHIPIDDNVSITKCVYHLE